MDCKIWKETIVSWVNSLDLFENDAKELTPKTVEEILKVLARPDENIFNFIHTNFPNYEINYLSIETATDRDILCTCTLLLIYVCFSTKYEMEALRQKMCVKLDNTGQENVTEFLMNINEQGDAFSCSQKMIIEEILKFSQRHSVGNSAYVDGFATPVKSFGSPGSCKSPLLEFLQTPKRKMESKFRSAFNSYNNNEQLKKIKNLTDQLVEEELEKASLQERLKQTEITCNEHEMRLNMKIKELEEIKADWQQDIYNNEKEIKQLQNVVKNDAEEREKLLKELNYLEKYVIRLENDLSNVTSEKKTLEERLKCALNKVNEQETSIIQLTEVVTELKDVIKAQEEDLKSLKENGENTLDNTFMDQHINETLDTSATVPENMEVVIEMLLKEKTEENETLKEAIEVIKCDKEYLAKEVKALKSQLSAMELEKSQLQELNRILVGKIDCFVKTCKDLQNMQSRLLSMTKVAYDNSGDNLIEKTEATADDDGNNENIIKNCDDALLTALNAVDSKELHVIYDSSKELTDSISQLSLDDNDTTHLATIMESLNESEDISSLSDSVLTNNENKTGLEQFQMEELSQEILTAKKSLVSFLKASMKNFEVLKIKESLLNAMSKEHEQLENRVMSLTELNARLTKEILKSNNISHIDSRFREQELDNLRLEVESLKKASELLREKLADLEKTNESLINKKKECLAELTVLREKNKSLNNDLQNKVMSHLKQQNACLGFIQSKQETELELEKSLKLKEELDKRFLELRKTIIRDSNSALEIMSNVAEQKFYVTSQNLLHTTYSILKWCAKIMQHQCFFIDQDENYSGDKLSESVLKKEQDEHREKLKQILSNLNDLSDDLNTIEMKYNEMNNLSDSLKILPPVNKTFEIINVDDENINEKTFSIKREMSEIKLAKNCNTTWVISPPTKQIRKVESQVVNQPKKNLAQATSWVITMSPPEKPNQANEKSEVGRKKSLYYSAVSDIEYSPTSKPEVTKSSSSSSFVSASGTVDFESQTVENEIGAVNDTKSVQVKEGKGVSGCCEKIGCSELRERLEKQIRDLQKELAAAVKENELVRVQLIEEEEQRKHEKDNFEKRQETTRQSITAKYENQLEHLKSEMKSLYNRELAKYKAEQSKKNYELLEQNKVYKDHVDELRNQLWDLGEKLLHEQKLKRDLEQTVEQIKKKLTSVAYNEFESRNSQDSDFSRRKERPLEKNFPPTYKQFGGSSFVTMPTEDEDEVFDNRCLEDMKAGVCKVEGPEGRLTELQYRNSLCLPHLKSSYPAETQFHNPELYKENDLKYGGLTFGQESQSLTDSDHSMTRSLLPGEKGKKKEQPSYKKPGPPTPSKNGGRLSIQSGDFHITPRRPLRDTNDFSDRRSTPARIKALFTTKSGKQDVSKKDENTAPTACRGKKLKIFPSVKPFGGRDY